MKIIKLESYRQPSGTEITLRKVRVACNLSAERLVGNHVQEGWYGGWGEDVLHRIYNGWVKFEQRINSTPL